jgi:hypothetical protein
MDEHRSSYIRYFLPGGGLKGQDQWPEIQGRMIDTMVRFEKALKPHIMQL